MRNGFFCCIAHRFNEFRQKVLRELLEVVGSSGAMPGGDEETLTIHRQSSPLQVAEAACSHQLVSEVESSLSSSLTQVKHTRCHCVRQSFMFEGSIGVLALVKWIIVLEPLNWRLIDGIGRTWTTSALITSTCRSWPGRWIHAAAMCRGDVRRYDR